ncbi:DUF4268 domain-containing protein [Brumimicrobium glaciale]|jgi:hypothetical protein|uniref:DUF4268 domain-containing protein n=1 Tax=Brumimicrobium glaciale TaxID=200475 RepID=A0A4Q4KK54_9FLAO|nr:DUF4268 domain-containing protein [Brumimicrobium glaciale]RYM33595.1 DUF4268 domain-containing protein [Brumimicrobium glaciale]
MFSKEEQKSLNAAFWTRFKEQAGVNKSANGKRVNWVNYPTHLKQLYVRLHADTEIAKLSIDIQAKNEGVRLIIWEQMTELRKVMEAEMITPGLWEETSQNIAGQTISRISWTLEDVNMYVKEDQDKIFGFFIPLLVGFDKFYTTYDEVLIGLVR